MLFVGGVDEGCEEQVHQDLVYNVLAKGKSVFNE